MPPGGPLARSSTYRSRRQSLARGYLYQDLVASAMFVRTLLDGHRAIEVETAEVAGEVFDDHVLTLADGVRRRVQVKHSDPPHALTESEFTASSGRLNVDLLIAQAQQHAGDEFRLFATWTAPANAGWLVPTAAARLDPALATTLWRLDAEAIWPNAGRPRWDALATFERGMFVALCDQFVLELDAPAMSGDIAAPGPLEQRLLDALRDELEIGRPPNLRDPEDVAAVLLVAAYTARSTPGSPTRFGPALIIERARLVLDTDRLAAAFPLERERLVPTSLFADLVAATRLDGLVVVTGPPGAGKSWALEAVVGQLRARGAAVARHYCYLEPGDPDARERVGIEALCSNLIAEIRRDPRLRDVHPGFARDLLALGDAITRAVTALSSGEHDDADASGGHKRRLVLIVDGIDHVARVDPEAGARAVSDLVLGLAAISLPPGVTLVVGSQPGSFLDPILANARVLHPPRFDRARVREQLDRFDVPRLIRERGATPGVLESLVDVFTQRSDGNPLYVRFLALELIDALERGVGIPDVLRLHEGLPAGELSAYYAHLLSSTDDLTSVVAEQLAVLDFAVVLEELCEILPALSRERVASAASRLRPLLAPERGDGIRIYHESLRRFVIERVRARGEISNLSAAAVAWLDAKGFFADDRAFRWLLPMLRRAGRDEECLGRIEADFIARSVVELHPGVAVFANLTAATYAARNLRNFVALAQLAELWRAAEATYDERMTDMEEYGRTIIALRGAPVLRRRVLYDGRPVYPRAAGLRLCALIEEAGTAAPWSEYLALADPEDGTRRDRSVEDLDALYGRLSIAGAAAVAPSVSAWLERHGGDTSKWYLQALADLTGKVYGSDVLGAILQAVPAVAPQARRAFDIALAGALAREGQPDLAIQAGMRALQSGVGGVELRSLLDAGVPATEIAARCAHPVTLIPAVTAERHYPDASAVDAFVTSCLAYGAAAHDLVPLKSMIGGDGWYRGWLRFVVDLGIAYGRKSVIVEAFENVARDTRPFAGQPRAVDLFEIRDLIDETARRGLKLATSAERREIVAHLLRVAYGTTTTLGNTPSGPLTIQALLALLEEAPERDLVTFVDSAIARRSSDVYETHATDALTLARLWHAVGDEERAEAHWQKARRFLAAYGYHKDVAIFGLIHAVEALASRAPAQAHARLLGMRPLTDLVCEHTDGDETRHAPSAWFRVLAKIDPLLATRTLTTVIARSRVPSTLRDELLSVVLAQAPESLDPRIRHLLWRCVPGRDHARDRLDVVDEMLARNEADGQIAFRSAAADIEGDAEVEATAIEELRRFAADRGLADPGVGLSTPRPAAKEQEPLPAPGQEIIEGPFFRDDAGPTDLLLGVRKLPMGPWGRHVSQQAVARELAAHLRRLSLSDEAAVLMDEIARSRPYLDGQEFFEALAGELREWDRALAAQAYVHAWCAARPDWDVFGGLTHIDLVVRAIALDGNAALDCLASQVAAAITGGRTLGLSRRIVEFLFAAFGRTEDALAAWDSACDVIAYRLPALGDEVERYPVPEAQCSDPNVIYGELLGALLMHPVYERRAAAMAACVELCADAPDLVRAALSFAVGSHSVFTDRTIALQLALDMGILPSPVDRILELAATEPMAVAVLAGRLLERVGQRPARRDAYVWIPPRVNGHEIREALRSDYAGRAERLAGAYWVGFPDYVADAWWRLRRAQGDAERIRRDQVEEQASISARWVPVLELHDWYRELFEVALNQSLWALKAYRAQEGHAVDYGVLEQSVLRIVAPDSRTSQARGRSRILRPPGPLPSEATPGWQPVREETAGIFAGWSRVAYLEREAVAPTNQSDRGRMIMLRSGLISKTSGTGEPVPIAPRRLRWHDLPEGADESPHAVAQFFQQMDCTAWKAVIAPVARVRHALGLRPAALVSPLDLLDASGSPGVCLRYWRMRPYGYDYGPQTPLVDGAALFVRGDLMPRLNMLMPDLATLVVIESEELPFLEAEV